MPKATSDTDAPSRRAERRAAQQDISRTQLLDAAEEVFGQKGFHEATLREVADLAEFSVGSLYSFFEGKDELFSQIFLRRVDEFMPALAAVLNDEAADPRQQLHALVDFQIGFFRAHPNFGRLYLRYSSGTGLTIDSEVDAILNARYDDAMARQGALIRRGQELGVFHPGDPDVFARLLCGLVSAYQALDPTVATRPARSRRAPPAGGLPRSHQPNLRRQADGQTSAPRDVAGRVRASVVPAPDRRTARTAPGRRRSGGDRRRG